MRQQLDEVQSTVADMSPEARADVASQVTGKITSQIQPAIAVMRKSIAAVSTAAVAPKPVARKCRSDPRGKRAHLDRRIADGRPGVGQISSELTAATAELADVSVDGSKIAATVTATSDRLTSIQALLDRWTQQTAQAGQALAAAEAATPPLIDWTSVALSLLFLLFGAGQLCLMATAIQQLPA